MKTDAIWRAAYRLVAEQEGFGFIDTDSYYVPGENSIRAWQRYDALFRLGLGKKTPELGPKIKEAFRKLLPTSELEVADGFWALVRELKLDKEIKIVLTTNTDADTTLEMSKLLDLEGVFDFVVTGDDVKNPKPAPDIYKKALKATRLKKHDVLVFEDSLIGVEAAAKAGLDIVVIYDGVSPQASFKGNVLLFVPNFSPFPGNLDLTYEEAAYQGALEFQKNRARRVDLLRK